MFRIRSRVSADIALHALTSSLIASGICEDAHMRISAWRMLWRGLPVCQYLSVAEWSGRQARRPL